MCLTQQEGEVRNILISSQIQQQSLGFLQRHRGAFGDDSDSDSDDDDDNDNGATFSALPDAYKRGALFSGLGGGQSQPQQQSTTSSPTAASAGFLKNDEESDSDDEDDDGAAAFASLPEEYKKGALFAGFGMQQESAALAAAAAAAPRPTSNSAEANNDDDDSDDDSDIGAAFASLPEEYRRGALFAGLGMKVSNSSDAVDAESDSKLPAVSNATTDDEDVQAKRARLMQQRRRPAEAETVNVAAVPSPPQQVQRVSLSEQDIEEEESDDDAASTKQAIGLVHHNTKPFATAASAVAARRTDSSAVVASSSSAKLPSVSFGGHDANEKFDFHFIGTSLRKEISYRSVAKSEAVTIGVVGLNQPFTASTDAVHKNEVAQVSDEYYTTDAHKDDDEEEDEHDHFHHRAAAVAILSPPIRRTSKEFDEESVVSEMTRLSAMTTFSSDYTCDTVDTAFFLDDISEEGHLSSPSDLDDHEDDEDDDDDSILNEEHLKTLINCATQQLDQETQGTHHQDASVNTAVIPPLSWNNASPEAVAEAVSLTADLFSVPAPTGRSDAMTLLKEQHAPIVFHTISGATDAASSCCWNHHNAEDVAAFPFCEVEQLVRRDSDGSALGELRKMNWEQLARDVKEEEAAAAAEARAKKEFPTVKATENEKPAAAGTAAAIRHDDDNEDECCDRSAEQLQKHAHRMTTSHASQVELQKWDAKMGLRRCHCKTMMDTCASRRALLQVVGVHVEEYEPPAVLSRKRSRAAAAVAAAKAVSDAYTGEVASSSAVVAVSRSQKQSRMTKKSTPDRTMSSKGKEEDQKSPVVKMIHGVPRVVHAPLAPASSSNTKKTAADFVTSSSHSPSKVVGESFMMNHSAPAFLSNESGMHHPLPKKLKTQADMPSISFNAVA